MFNIYTCLKMQCFEWGYGKERERGGVEGALNIYWAVAGH